MFGDQYLINSIIAESVMLHRFPSYRTTAPPLEPVMCDTFTCSDGYVYADDYASIECTDDACSDDDCCQVEGEQNTAHLEIRV